MERRKFVFTILILLMIYSLSFSQETTEVEQPYLYTIVDGDTLWDISARFLRDPMLWPRIWEQNTYISNPDLIFPDNQLVIPGLTSSEIVRSPVTGMESLKTESVEESYIVTEEMEEESPRTSERDIKVSITDSFVLSSGYVIPEKDIKVKGTVAGLVLKSDIELISQGDKVVLSVNRYDDVELGKLYVIFRVGKSVKNFKGGEYLGNIVNNVGIARIYEIGEESCKAEIIRSYIGIKRGDFIQEYDETEYMFVQSYNIPAKTEGYISAIKDDLLLTGGQQHFVFLNLGTYDGIETGMHFRIYKDLGTIKDYMGGRIDVEDEPIAEVIVINAKEYCSTCNVLKSKHNLEIGDRAVFLKMR